MKIRLVIFAAVIWLAAATVAPAQTTNSDESAIRAALEIYIKARASGEGGDLPVVFYSEAKIQGIRPTDGEFISFKFEDYVKTFPGKRAADEDKRRRRIETVDVTKNAAVAKLVFDYPAVKITDYMLLLKIGGEWKIVNKIAQGEPKPKPNK